MISNANIAIYNVFHLLFDVFRHAFCIIMSMYGDLSGIFLIFVCNENDYSY